MKLKYSVDHLDFVKYDDKVIDSFKYVAQSRNGTWAAFNYKPVVDKELSIWTPNLTLSKQCRQYILYDPFDGYPQNENWENEIYTTTELYDKLCTTYYYDVLRKNYITKFVNSYVLFYDGTFGIIVKLRNGHIAIKSFANTFTDRNEVKVDFIELNSGFIFTNSGILPSRHAYLDYYQDGVYVSNKFRIARVFKPEEIIAEQDVVSDISVQVVQVEPLQTVVCESPLI